MMCLWDPIFPWDTTDPMVSTMIRNACSEVVSDTSYGGLTCSRRHRGKGKGGILTCWRAMLTWREGPGGHEFDSTRWTGDSRLPHIKQTGNNRRGKWSSCRYFVNGASQGGGTQNERQPATNPLSNHFFSLGRTITALSRFTEAAR